MTARAVVRLTPRLRANALSEPIAPPGGSTARVSRAPL